MPSSGAPRQDFMENTSGRNLVRQAYEAFNARSPTTALATLHEQVQWDDGEGHMLSGRVAVREHWLLQWAEANPSIEIIGLSDKDDGVVARIRLTLFTDGKAETREITNVFTFRDDLIRSMRIR
jgi:hypothetical protein